MAFGPRQSKDGVRFKPQGRAAQGAFQHGCTRVVADQHIAQTVGVSVRCAAAAVALGSIAHAARILHSCKRAGVQYGDAHAVPSFAARVANSAAVMGSNFMRSPAV